VGGVALSKDAAAAAGFIAMASAIGTGAIVDTRASLLAVDTAMTSCMPCSFALLPQHRSGACAQPTGLREVTVIDRSIPLVPAAYGTRVARPVRATGTAWRRWLDRDRR
jgi:hypothetical protein